MILNKNDILTRNEVFILPREYVIDEDEAFTVTSEILQTYIDVHRTQLLPKYIEWERLYYGEHDILSQARKELYKPDNRLVVNFPKYIVDTFNGYFIGIPVKFTHDNDGINVLINDFVRDNDLSDVDFEVSKMSSIFGRSYYYLYQNENSETKCTYASPKDTFVVYDDTIEQNELFAVNYKFTSDGKVFGDLYIGDKHLEFKNLGNGLVISDSGEPNFFDGLPIIEVIESEERQSIFANVETLINALNKSLSEKANDVDYFADAYMKVIGAELGETQLKKLRDTRIINISGDLQNAIEVDFLQKPNADETQEHLLDRLIELIYQMSMVANINDVSVGENSGVALEFKLQPMKNLALNKERKISSAMRERFKLFFGLPTNIPVGFRDEWTSINYRFTRNIPRNVSDEAETAAKLEGIVSKETQLSTLSIVDNVKDEIETMKDEEAEKVPQQLELDLFNQENKDSEKIEEIEV